MWVDLFNPKKDSIEIHNIPLLLKNLRIRKKRRIYIDSWVKICLCCVTTCHKLDDYHKLGRRALSWHKTLLQLTLTTYSEQSVRDNTLSLRLFTIINLLWYQDQYRKSSNICSSINTILLWSLVGNAGINNRKRRFYYFIISLSVYFYCK